MQTYQYKHYNSEIIINIFLHLINYLLNVHKILEALNHELFWNLNDLNYNLSLYEQLQQFA